MWPHSIGIVKELHVNSLVKRSDRLYDALLCLSTKTSGSSSQFNKRIQAPMQPHRLVR